MLAELLFLADESCDFAAVRALRAARFDVQLEIVNRYGTGLRSAFTVLQPTRIRISKLPPR